MNRTLALLVLLVGLGGITYWLSQRENRANQPSLTWEREFKVNADAVARIFLYNKKTDTRTTLERRDDHWIVNGRYRVNPNVMNNFLATVGNLQMNYVPGQAAVMPAIQVMATQGIYVQLFDGSGEQLRAYTIGGNTADAQGTYALIEGSEQPHVLSLPYFNGNIRGLYALREYQWRDKALTVISPETVQKLTVDYPKQRSSAFVLERTDGRARVVPLYPATARRGDTPAPGAVDSYLDGFERLMAEALINENPRRAEITATLPFAVFTFERTDGPNTTLKLWPQVDPDREGQLTSADYERYFVEVSEGASTDFFAAQHRVISPILRDYAFFYGG